MADGDGVRRRRELLEGVHYRQALERLANFIDNEVGQRRGENGQAARPRPDAREWRIQRTNTIRALNEYKEKLDSVCVKANVGKAMGNSAEIVGSVSAVVGAFMSLFGLPSGAKIINIGNMVHNTGTCVDNASRAIESLFSEGYLRKIEAVLRRDKELSRPLAEWLNFTNQLNVDIKEIFGVRLTSGILNITLRVFHEMANFIQPSKTFNETLNLMRQQRYSVIIGDDVRVEKLQKFFQHLSDSPQLAEKIRKALALFRAQPHHVQLLANGFQIYHDFYGSSETPSLQSGLKLETPTVGEVSGFCFFQAISLANSIFSLRNAQSIIKCGVSKYSDALVNLISCLSLELRRMEDF